MAKPERGQIPFIFERWKDPDQFYYASGFAQQENPDGAGRFVRKLREEIQIRTPADAAEHLQKNVFAPFEAFDQEELWCLLVDTKNRITHEAMIYRGTVNSIHIRPAELFKEAVRVNAPALLLSHCHPSGLAEPSPQDIQVTLEAYRTGQILGIELLDHLIIGKNVWVSLREQGLGFG